MHQRHIELFNKFRARPVGGGVKSHKLTPRVIPSPAPETPFRCGINSARDPVLLQPSAGLLRFARNDTAIFDEIISLENLFSAWQEFKKGKSKKPDVQEFEFNLENNLFQLHRELVGKTYCHSYYTAFNICDPKPRRIHKACVRDRVLHHAVFRILYPIFDKSFIFDSYSCRLQKGTHRAVTRLEKFCRKLSKNNRKNTFILKCDIKKFFDSVDQDILLELIGKKIQDEDAIWLVGEIIKSFKSKAPASARLAEASAKRAGDSSAFGLRTTNGWKGKGLPLGNVTSQLFANIYLDKFDQFVKHKLKIKYYLRYCDDFIILGEDGKSLPDSAAIINTFLEQNLKLQLHSDKIQIRKYHQGIDFLGYVVLSHYRVLRTKTKKRIFKKVRGKRADLEAGLISEVSFGQSLQSYLGVLKHCAGHKIFEKIRKICLNFATCDVPKLP